jgi:hypothetical protein
VETRVDQVAAVLAALVGRYRATGAKLSEEEATVLLRRAVAEVRTLSLATAGEPPLQKPRPELSRLAAGGGR